MQYRDRTMDIKLTFPPKLVYMWNLIGKSDIATADILTYYFAINFSNSKFYCTTTCFDYYEQKVVVSFEIKGKKLFKIIFYPKGVSPLPPQVYLAASRGIFC